VGVRVGETARSVGEIVRASGRKVRRRNLTFVAGSLAYNAFVSLIPLSLLLLLAVGQVGDERLATRVVALSESALTPEAQSVVADALTNASGQTGLSVAGLVVLLWGALKLFRGLDTAFAAVYDTTDEVTLLGQLRDGIVALVVVAVSLFAVGLAAGAFAYFRLPSLHLLNPLLLLCGLTLAFLPMYYVFPDVDVALDEALPGAVVAAAGWAVLEVGFQLYAANAARYEAYGVVGGVLLSLTWLYFSGLVVLVGAAVNAVIWERRGGGASDANAPDDTTSGEHQTPDRPDPRTGRSGARSSGGGGPDSPAAAVETDARRSRRSRRPRRSSHTSFALGVAVGAVGVVAVLVGVIRRWTD
jgi:membrane protein